MAERRQHIIHGLRDGVPIAMGYFAVTFSLGIIAARAGRDDLPRYDYGYANSIARHHCAVGWHRCSMVSPGTIPSRCYLLCHRLSIDLI